MIISAKSQFNWLKWFLTRRFFKFRPMRTHYGPWQPCWISNQHQKHKSDRKFKMAAMTRLSLTLNTMGISYFHLFFWNHKTDLNQTCQKCSLDGHIQDFCFWRWSEIQHTNLVEDHLMNISGKFGWNLFSGFSEEDLNVKS
jgi:hypothetical protein